MKKKDKIEVIYNKYYSPVFFTLHPVESEVRVN